MSQIGPKDYCSKEPYFPQQAFIVYLFYGEEERLLLFPVSQVFPEIEIIQEPVLEVVEYFKKKEIHVPEHCIIMPIKFLKKVPLKRKYWRGHHEEYTEEERFHLFLQLLDKPELHELLVTPGEYIEELDFFKLNAALPLKSSSPDSMIESFMQHSDYVVDERAKSAAVYTVDQPMRYNWITKKIDYPEKIIKKDKLQIN